MERYTFVLSLLSFFFMCSSLTDAKPEIIVSDVDIQVGNDQLILCKANKEADIEWLKDDEEVDLDRHKENKEESKSALILKKVVLGDSGNYKCVCSSDSGETSSSVNIYVYDGPNFGKTKTYHEFLVNQTVRIPCEVSGKPAVEIIWYWKGSRVFNNDISNMRVQPDGSLQITSIQRENHGTYNCEGKIKGRPISKVLNISVVVNVPPTVRFNSKKAHVLAGPNKSMTINCLVTGAPHPNITWTTPSMSNSSRYIYNSDRSTLTIPAVARSDYGNYVCTAVNKIGEASAVFELDVSESPSIILSQERMVVKLGESAYVSCNGTGYPTPTVQWIRRSNEHGMSTVQQPKVEGSNIIFDSLVPSDGGVYSCKASNEAGVTTVDFTLMTSPDKPVYFNLSPEPTSARITLHAPILDGGSPITQYIIQFRKQSQDDWGETVISSSDPLVLTSLDPYTEYFVRFAAQNEHFVGGFSDEKKIFTLARREPDIPMLFPNEEKLEGNSYTVPFKQLNDGGSPILHYEVHYRVDKEGEPWKTKQIAADSHSIQLLNLEYSSDYQVEMYAVNINGSSNPAKISFSVPEAQPSLGKGGVVGIVMVIFLLLLVAVDAFCCYKNNCGLLNSLNQKLFGHKISKMKDVEDGVINNAVDMTGLDKPRGSIPKLQSQKGASNGVQSEVTSDKAPLTKFEKAPAKSNPTTET